MLALKKDSQVTEMGKIEFTKKIDFTKTVILKNLSGLTSDCSI